MEGYTLEYKGLRFFDPGERFWTPGWDFENKQAKRVLECKLANGSWHKFKNMVCEIEARKFQAMNGGIVS